MQGERIFAYCVAAAIFLLLGVAVIERNGTLAATLAPLATMAAGFVFSNLFAERNGRRKRK